MGFETFVFGRRFGQEKTVEGFPKSHDVLTLASWYDSAELYGEIRSRAAKYVKKTYNETLNTDSFTLEEPVIEHLLADVLSGRIGLGECRSSREEILEDLSRILTWMRKDPSSKEIYCDFSY